MKRVLTLVLLAAGLALTGSPAAMGGESYPAAPTDLTVVEETPLKVQLTWTDNSDNEDGFFLWRTREGAPGDFAEYAVPAGWNSFSDTNILPNTIYYYRVWAYNEWGGSTSSNTAIALVPPAKPILVQPDVTGDGLVALEDGMAVADRFGPIWGNDRLTYDPTLNNNINITDILSVFGYYGTSQWPTLNSPSDRLVLPVGEPIVLTVAGVGGPVEMTVEGGGEGQEFVTDLPLYTQWVRGRYTWIPTSPQQVAITFKAQYATYLTQETLYLDIQ